MFITQKTQRRKVFGGIETDAYDLSDFSPITPLMRQLQINHINSFHFFSCITSLLSVDKQQI